MSISRRDFLGTSAAAGLTAATLGAGSDKGGLPTRMLGKTGAHVSILAFGGGSRFVNNKDDDETIGILQKALDAGVTYIDTADDYGREHLSERRIAQAIKGKRDRLFLATKLSNRDGKETQRIVELSLKSLGVDRVDLLHIHSLLSEEDLGVIEAKGGVLEQVQKIRDQKMARFIGITCHADPVALKTALERHDFDCTQMALNAAMRSQEKTAQPSFETVALPVALRKKMGVTAMKIFAADVLVGQAPNDRLIRYSMSLPVAATVIGMPKVEHI